VKNKILREDNTKLDFERQVAGVGPGSKDDPFVQLAIPLKRGLGDMNQSINYPHEINRFKEQLFHIFEKLIELRSQFQRALENPSVTDSQKIALDKSIKRIDIINKKLIQIPDFLSLFSVDS
jgi:hypothetical protein